MTMQWVQDVRAREHAEAARIMCNLACLRRLWTWVMDPMLVSSPKRQMDQHEMAQMYARRAVPAFSGLGNPLLGSGLWGQQQQPSAFLQRMGLSPRLWP
jgi:hypothetical protein